MNSNNKKIYIGLLTILFMLVSFILLFNDLINYFIVSLIITIMLFSYLVYITFKKNDEDSIYKREIKRIFRTYDSILVYSDNNYKLNDQEIVIVNKLEDIVKVSEALNLPILVINEKDSCIFICEEGICNLIYIKKKNNSIVSKYEEKINKRIKDNKSSTDSKQILKDIEKTTLIKLKNNKTYKVSPVKKK